MVRRACALGFRLGEANPHAIFWSWHPTNTTSTSSSPRSLYKQHAPTVFTPDRYRARHARFSVSQGKTLAPPDLPFLAYTTTTTASSSPRSPYKRPAPSSSTPTDTEHVALGFRFGRAKPWPRPISCSWRPTTTTTASSSPHCPYKRSAPMASTLDRYRVRRAQFSVWQGKTPPPPGLPFLAFHHHHHRFLLTSWTL